MVDRHMKKITNWHELCEFIESTNNFKDTIIMTGYVNKIVGDRLKIHEIFLSTTDINILQHKQKKRRKNGRLD